MRKRLVQQPQPKWLVGCCIYFALGRNGSLPRGRRARDGDDVAWPSSGDRAICPTYGLWRGGGLINYESAVGIEFDLPCGCAESTRAIKRSSRQALKAP